MTTLSQTTPTHRLSFTNLVAGGTVTPSSEDADYPAEYVKDAGRPFLPWRTGALGEQTLVVDLLGAPAGQVLIVLNRTNFTSAKVQGNTTNSWGSPAVSQDVVIANNPFNGRYMHSLVFTTFPYQYLRIVVPAQTPVDAAAYYLLGGLWCGVATTVPSNVLAEIEIETKQPKRDLRPEHEGWRQRLILGEELVVLTVPRQAKITRLAPGRGNDHLARWAALDRLIWSAGGRFAFFFNAGDPTQGYIVFNVEDTTAWKVANRLRSTSDWKLEESIQ